jgi:tetratricopeptide (TPR) repeat protein
VHLRAADRARGLRDSVNEELAAQAEEAETTELVAAEEAFNRAIELKGDYAPAHYYLAVTYERQGRLDEAAARMVALRNYAPLDVGIGLQLGLLFLRQQSYEQAAAEFERLVALQERYSNARWYLASAYELLDRPEDALEQLRLVEELNPDNELVRARIEQLEAGEQTAAIPRPVEEGDVTATEVEEGEVEVTEEPSVGDESESE